MVCTVILSTPGTCVHQPTAQKKWLAGSGIAAALAFVVIVPVVHAAPSLSLPIACKIGINCHVQNYVDDDPTSAAGDYLCGNQTYDGHKGTDIRLLNIAAMNRGVKVIAAAAGRVKGVRDGVADISIRDQDAAIVSGKECGNGVVVELGGDWVTQYCHMKKGSVRVKLGDQVKIGTTLGEVGLSGMTEFPHLHFEVRRGKAIIDPFTGEEAPGARNCKPSKSSLWNGKARDALAYRPVSLLAVGFTEEAPTTRSIEIAEPPIPDSVSPALMAWVRMIGVRAGDVQTLTVTDPLNETFAENGPVTLSKSKAQWLAFAGRKRTVPSWPLGKYKAHFTLKRKGEVIVDREFSFSLVR
jgi:murein DD-endopeptidase MepM/ murein hydrolase activator NlpD